MKKKGRVERYIQITSLSTLIHFRTQSDDLISCYGKPVEGTNEIAYPLISYPFDFIGPLHCFPIASDPTVGLYLKVVRSL